VYVFYCIGLCLHGAGKAAKKNQKRAARRKEEGGPGWDASSANGSVSGTTTGLEEVQSQASLGWDNNNAAAGDTASVASGARFITSE
jgi:catalase (peroxidase I)